METPVVQRWRDRRGVYRLAREPITTLDYEVVRTSDDTTARAFVERHHYSGSFPAAQERFELHHRLRGLVGVAVFSVAFRAAMVKTFAGVLEPKTAAEETTELGRLVLLDSEGANAESFFVGEAFSHLRAEGYAGVLSFSDPVPRHDATGAMVFPGHIGGIYQALNAAYLGLATPRTLHLFADGTVFNARAQQKIRDRSKGWVYAVDQLVKAGAEPPRDDLRAWLRYWLPRVTRTMRHGGNHRYCWLLHRRSHARKLVPMGQPYPKFNMETA